VFEGFALERIEVGEVTLRVRHGGSGPAVLLLHGHPRTHVTWHKVAPLLADSFTVVCPDSRGYPVGAARLDTGLKLEPLELLADQVSDADREREAAVGRVEIEEHEVRALRLVDAGVPSVHVDAVHLHHPEHRLRRVDEREVDEPRLTFTRVGAVGARRDPGGHPLQRLLLEVRLPGHPVGRALHRERPVAEVRDEHRRDRAAVLEQVLLRDPFVGEQDTSGLERRTDRGATERVVPVP